MIVADTWKQAAELLRQMGPVTFRIEAFRLLHSQLLLSLHVAEQRVGDLKFGLTSRVRAQTCGGPCVLEVIPSTRVIDGVMVRAIDGDLLVDAGMVTVRAYENTTEAL